MKSLFYSFFLITFSLLSTGNGQTIQQACISKTLKRYTQEEKEAISNYVRTHNIEYVYPDCTLCHECIDISKAIQKSTTEKQMKRLIKYTFTRTMYE